MAIKKKSETGSNKQEKAKVKVLHAYQYKTGDIGFSMEYKGVSFYNLVYKVESDKIDTPFVSFPSRKGKDGKYYNYYWFKIGDDMLEDIELQIGELL